MSLLEISNLKVRYGGIEALKGVSFTVEKGQIVTLIGANGAGKSTTLRAISGLVPAAEGSIVYDGRSIGGIGPQNAGEVVGAGAEILVAGSAVFKAENPGEVIGKMRI